MDSIKILVVEDDREINHLISKYLSKEGYLITNAFDGKEAIHLLSSNAYQMIVLDLMIPKADGFEVLRMVRDKGNIPVLILSARNEESDKIIGLGLGADDYMTKPFSISELIARVKAQLRRYLDFSLPLDETTNLLKYADLELDLNDYSMKLCGRSVSLTAKELEILKLFLLNPKKVFTKAQIFSAVWKEDYISDENTVMVHIRRLREKIETAPSTPKYIQTVWGIGYRLGEV